MPGEKEKAAELILEKNKITDNMEIMPKLKLGWIIGRHNTIDLTSLPEIKFYKRHVSGKIFEISYKKTTKST